MGNVLTWKDVLDTKKLPGRPYYEKACEMAKSVGYKFIAFNDYVYFIEDSFVNPLGSVENLENGQLIDVSI